MTEHVHRTIYVDPRPLLTSRFWESCAAVRKGFFLGLALGFVVGWIAAFALWGIY